MDLQELAKEFKLTKEQVILAQKLNLDEEQIKNLSKEKNLFQPKRLFKEKVNIEEELKKVFVECYEVQDTWGNNNYLEFIFNTLSLLFTYSTGNFIEKVENLDIYQNLDENELQNSLIKIVKNESKKIKLRERKNKNENEIIAIVEKEEVKEISPFE